MPVTGYPQRQYIRQPFPHAALSVPISPANVPLNSDPNLVMNFVDMFAICVPSTAANPVFLGALGVTTANGIELIQGNIYAFPVSQEGRYQYELVDPLLQLARMAQCEVTAPEQIPFVCWDLSQLALTAVAVTDVRIVYSANQFV